MSTRAYGNGRLVKRPNADGTSTWCAQYRDSSGRRKRVGLSTDRRVAERALALRVRDRDLELLGLKVEDNMEQRLSAVRELYIADLPTYAKAGQVRRIGYVTNKVIRSIGDRPVRDLRIPMVLAYRQRRIAEKAARRTVNLEVGGVCAMLNWALRSGVIGRNPLATLQPLPAGKAHEKHPRRPLTEDELARFMAAAIEADVDAVAHLNRRPGQQERLTHAGCPRIPQAPLWRALLYTGARWGELTASTWADFDTVGKTLRLRAETTKSAKERVLPLVAAVVVDLTEMRALHGRVLGRDPRHGDRIFLGPMGKPIEGNATRARWRFRQVLKRAGIPYIDELGKRVVIHSTRHTFGTGLARAGVGLAQVQHLLGHSDPKLTASIYTHLDAGDLRAAVERLGSA